MKTLTTETTQEFINTFCRSKEDCEIIICFLYELSLKDILLSEVDIEKLTTINYSIKEELVRARNETKRIDSRAMSLAWALTNGGIPNV